MILPLRLLLLVVCIKGQHRGNNMTACHCKSFAGSGTSIWELDNVHSVFKCFSKCASDATCEYFAFDITNFTCTASMSSLMDTPGNQIWYDHKCVADLSDVQTTRLSTSVTTKLATIESNLNKTEGTTSSSTTYTTNESKENQTFGGTSSNNTTNTASVSESRENQTADGTTASNTTYMYNGTDIFTTQPTTKSESKGNQTFGGTSSNNTTNTASVSESKENQTADGTTASNTTYMYNGTDIFTTQPTTKSAAQKKLEEEKARKAKAERKRRYQERLKIMRELKRKRNLYWKNDHNPSLKNDRYKRWRKGETRYNIEVVTGFDAFAGSGSAVTLYVESVSKAYYWFQLYPGLNGFEDGSINYFYFEKKNIGPLVKFGLRVDSAGMAPSWQCDGLKVYIQIYTGTRFQIIPYILRHNRWIPNDNSNFLYRFETENVWLAGKMGKFFFRYR